MTDLTRNLLTLYAIGGAFTFTWFAALNNTPNPTEWPVEAVYLFLVLTALGSLMFVSAWLIIKSEISNEN